MTRVGRPAQPWRHTVEAYPCETCGAGPGDHCHGPYPLRAVKYEPHAARARLASQDHWRNPDVDQEPER